VLLLLCRSRKKKAAKKKKAHFLWIADRLDQTKQNFLPAGRTCRRQKKIQRHETPQKKVEMDMATTMTKHSG
jgi:hypothetical protein